VRAVESGIRFVALPFRNELDLATLSGLRRIVRQYRPDVIHVHKGLSHTLALAATWRSPVKAFVVNRGVSFPLRLWNRMKYRTSRVDRIVTVCEDIRRIIVRSGGVPAEKVEVIYAGVDLSRFDPQSHDRRELRDELGIPPDSLLVMQIGVREWKGWRELIEAFGSVAMAMPSARLALIACKSEEQKREVLGCAKAAGVEDKVIAVGYRADMPRVLASADVVVDASWGGTGITGTIREAMAMRKPVIATDCGGNRELISSPEVGLLVPRRDRDALVTALTSLMRDSALRERMAEAGMQHVRQNFSKERRIDRLESLYRSIIAQQ
jgi:glycosyltransferase involved in cell wall biosynthesis